MRKQSVLRRTGFGVLAALVGLAAITLGTASPAQARHWHHGFGFGPAFVGGLALGAVGAPYYYGGPYAYDYDPGCFIRHRVVYDRWGHRFIRPVRVCY